MFLETLTITKKLGLKKDKKEIKVILLNIHCYDQQLLIMNVKLTCLVICLITVMVSATYPGRGKKIRSRRTTTTKMDPILKKQIEEFNDFKTKFNRTYATIEEEQKAKVNLINNIAMNELHNKKFLTGESLFEMGESELSDMTAKEINDQMNGLLELNSTVIQHEKAIATTIAPITEELTCEYDIEHKADQPAVQGRALTTPMTMKTTKKITTPPVLVSADWRHIFNPVRFQGRSCGSCWGKKRHL